MIKLVYCVCRRSDVSAEAFYDYWLNTHGPKVRGVAEAIGAVRYVQSHTILPELNQTFQDGRGLDSPYDGITEVWFESLEAMQAAIGSKDGLDAAHLLVEDESRFIDFAKSSVFMTEEHEIFDLRAD